MNQNQNHIEDASNSTSNEEDCIVSWIRNCGRYSLPSKWKEYRVTPIELVGYAECTYFKSLPSKLKDRFYQITLGKVQRQFEISKVNPLHVDDSIRYFPHPEESPGLPYTLRWLKPLSKMKIITQKKEVDPLIIKQFIHNLKYGIYNKCRTPCTLSARITIPKKKKFRLICEYPAHMTYAEGMFAQPLIQGYLQDKHTPYGLWIQHATENLRAIQIYRRNSSCQWLKLYWNKMECIPAWLIRDCFRILRSYIDMSKYKFYGAPEDSYTLPRLWNLIVNYFINTPIKFPHGEVKPKHQGVPSNSYFTNMIQSIANAICTQYCLRTLGVSYSDVSQWYMGDNSLILLYSEIDIKAFGDLAYKVFGLHLNLDKTEMGAEVSFMGYKVSLIGRPVADYEKVLAQLSIDIPRLPMSVAGPNLKLPRGKLLEVDGYALYGTYCRKAF